MVNNLRYFLRPDSINELSASMMNTVFFLVLDKAMKKNRLALMLSM